jgi:predicted alpha/beta-fold hydrolase
MTAAASDAKSTARLGRTYSPSWWLPGPHARTIWGRFFRRTPPIPTRTERWDTVDGDFLDIVRLEGGQGHPRLVMLHGLEGAPRSHYARGLFLEAARRGWSADLLIFRGCGAEPNRNPRFYHSGETEDVDDVVNRLIGENPEAPVVMAGVSLGGNVLLKWLGELGSAVPKQVIAAATVSVPFDLERAARHIERGFAQVYQQHFLKSLRRKALAKLDRYPGLMSRARVEAAHTLYDFDDAVTAPVHGFANASDYYTRSSSIRFLEHVRIPTLLLNAVDDPFLPADVLADVERVVRSNSYVAIEFPRSGGHVGFVSGHNPFRPFYYAEWRVAEFLEQELAAYRRRSGALGSIISSPERP